MKIKNVLVTGGSGFLLRNSLNVSNWNIINYKFNKEYKDIDLILHFGSPTDSYDFKDKGSMACTMVDLTLKIVDEALSNNCKLIFASSMGALYLEDEYSIYKRAMEQYIQATIDNFLILRIPRVYGTDRTKGLMKKIRLNEVQDYGKEVQYIDIEDFKEFFNECLNKTGLIQYEKELRKNTIQEIKEIYCKN